MRKYLILCFLTMAYLSSAFGQTGNASYRQDLANLLNRSATTGSGGQRKVYQQDFSKTPFIFKEWRYAKISFNDGKDYDSLYVNFDDDIQAILVTLGFTTEPFSFKSTDVKEFTFYEQPDRAFVGIKGSQFTDDEVGNFAFYEQVYQKESASGLVILKSYHKKFRDVESQVSYAAVKDEKGKYDLYSRYYIKQGEGLYKRITLGKKALQNLIGKSKIKEAQSLLKSKKLKWSSEEGFILVIQNMMD